MQQYDDDLRQFEARGAPALPPAAEQGYVERDGARIWYSTYGAGAPVVLLHGGLGHSGNWGYQLAPLLDAGRRVVLIDSRGHGRSTRDERPYSYEVMASDVLAVADMLQLQKFAVVGWSDGACIGLVLANRALERIAGVFFFACNMDPSGATEFEATPVIDRCFARHRKDYAELSATPDQFDDFVSAVSEMMSTQPNYSAGDLAEIRVPVAVVQAEKDEFIKWEHAQYLARSIPAADLIALEHVSHFAPLQRPDVFNGAMLAFLDKVLPTRT
ncbi:alpha/beta hydrolase [Sinorhizobium meliloti]|uniref:alpha/beta fold hydrolase n=1 Tax=Rhizobium meliloti TaxID=382 RepID=UPI000FD5E282|nr:alpha/beta hydrolase [Sinorhizobium meliloti]RVO40509.1 alpha/beta hydrolase [Sinorhizobium meliloti]